MKKEERLKRIIARGEHSNHAHIVVGDAEIDGDVITVNSTAKLRHLLESQWLEGNQV